VAEVGELAPQQGERHQEAIEGGLPAGATDGVVNAELVGACEG
jgi:hypothetical protein